MLATSIQYKRHGRNALDDNFCAVYAVIPRSADLYRVHPLPCLQASDMERVVRKRAVHRGRLCRNRGHYEQKKKMATQKNVFCDTKKRCFY